MPSPPPPQPGGHHRHSASSGRVKQDADERARRQPTNDIPLTLMIPECVTDVNEGF
jgi:hypothetical protein